MCSIPSLRRTRCRNHTAHGCHCTATLEKSDINLSIRQACGLKSCNDITEPKLAPMIRNRERGPNFTTGEMRMINNHFLPNRFRIIARNSRRSFCGTFSSDGKFLLTTVQDRAVNLYTSDNGRYKKFKDFTVSSVGWSILDTAFSPDNNHFVYSSWSNYLYLHSVYGNPDHQKPLLLLTGQFRLCIFSVIFCNDGKQLFCGGNDRRIYIYDCGGQRCVKKAYAHVRDINAVAFADDSSQILYSAGDDGFCKIWDTRTLRENDSQPVGLLAGHMDGITYIDSRGDGRYLITNSKDQTIKLWDSRLLSSKPTQKRLEDDRSIMTYSGHGVEETLIRCHFSPVTTTGQRYIYTGCSSGRVIIYDVLTGKIVKQLESHRRVVRDVSWHPTNQEIVSTSWDGLILSWQNVAPPNDIC